LIVLPLGAYDTLSESFGLSGVCSLRVRPFMATEVRCDVCGRTFEHEGSGPTVRCPYCQMTVKLPSGEVGSTSSGESAATAGNWHVHTCDGQRFGPITKEELDRWAAENRLTSSCQVYQDGWPAWRMAREFWPNLPPAAATSSAAAPNVGEAAASGSQNPYAAPAFSGAGSFGGATAYQIPHRGTLILILGILGFVMCGCFTALPAWIMGQSDLKQMRAGIMDNSGYSLTMAGMVLGIIQCILCVLAIVIYALIFAVFAAAH
jgi:hypothetical protein